MQIDPGRLLIYLWLCTHTMIGTIPQHAQGREYTRAKNIYKQDTSNIEHCGKHYDACVLSKTEFQRDKHREGSHSVWEHGLQVHECTAWQHADSKEPAWTIFHLSLTLSTWAIISACDGLPLPA